MKKEGEKPEEEQKAIIEKVHNCMDFLEQTLKTVDAGYLTGSEVTIADLQLFEECNTVSIVKADVLDPYPNLKKWFDLISKMPKVVELTAKAKEGMAALL